MTPQSVSSTLTGSAGMRPVLYHEAVKPRQVPRVHAESQVIDHSFVPFERAATRSLRSMRSVRILEFARTDLRSTSTVNGPSRDLGHPCPPRALRSVSVKTTTLYTVVWRYKWNPQSQPSPNQHFRVVPMIVILAFLLLISAVLLWYASRAKSDYPYPPSPPADPVIGHARLLSTCNRDDAYHALANKYGKSSQVIRY